MQVERAYISTSRCATCRKSIARGSKRLSKRWRDGTWTKAEHRCKRCGMALLGRLAAELTSA